MNVAARAMTERTESMRPADAMWHWLSTKFATDQFLVYAFAGRPDSIDQAVDEVIRRARECPDFGLRIERHNLNLRFPEWICGAVDPAEQVVAGRLDRTGWQDFLAELARLMERQLDPGRSTWRLHIFGDVADVPGTAGVSTVVVWQVSHALGDGTRTAALAGRLFGRTTGPAPVEASDTGGRMRRIVDDLRARHRLSRETASGLVPADRAPVPALSINRQPTGTVVLRTIACHPDDLPGPTVLVGALVAISTALSDHLRQCGEDVSRLTADVAIAKPGKPTARNHFDTYRVGLYPDVAPADERSRRIVADLMDIRRRTSHPAFAAATSGFDAVPAPLRRLGVWRLRADIGAAEVGANTVVSSVDRGAADLRFGGCPVVLTASYPSLMPTMGLTHGIHRIGDTVAVSVHTTRSVLPDVDGYLDRIGHALGR